MKTLGTDIDNDIYLGADGNIAIISALPAASQTAEHYGKTLRMEMIQEYDLGIPFFITAFGAEASIPQFEAAMRERILQTPEVLSITSFETTQDGEVLRYTATIETSYGQTTING